MKTMRKKALKSEDTVSVIPGRYKNNRYSLYRLVSAVCFLFMICLLLVIAAQYIQQLRVRQELAELEARIETNRDKQVALEIEVERLQELGYIESQARERLGLVKPGELIFQLED